MHQPPEGRRRSMAINVPVPENTQERPKTRRLSRSLDDIKRVKTFFYNQHIGSETRTMEFKEGGGDYKRCFGDDVRKYACGFLNSEGGRLMVGVNDAGRVLGLKIQHKLQDELRKTADGIFKKFNPPVQPNNYTLEFVPVKKEDGDDKDLKVLCLTLTPPTVLRKLYQTDTGTVFMRREGSVEKMNIPAIQEFHQKWTDEVRQVTEENKQLSIENKRKSSEMERLTRENERLSRENERLSRQQESSQDRPPKETKKRRWNPSGGGENSTVRRPHHEESDGREMKPIQDQMIID